MNSIELTLDQLSEFAGGQSLAHSSQGGIYQAKMLAETTIKTAAAASAVTGAMQTAATGAAIQTGAATGSIQASTAATGALAARVAASAPTGAK